MLECVMDCAPAAFILSGRLATYRTREKVALEYLGIRTRTIGSKAHSLTQLDRLKFTPTFQYLIEHIL